MADTFSSTVNDGSLFFSRVTFAREDGIVLLIVVQLPKILQDVIVVRSVL